MDVETVAGRSSIAYTVAVPVPALLDRLRRGLAAQRRFSLEGIDQSVVHLRARSNWATWGARVEVRLIPLDSETTRVEAVWKPALRSTLLIWGQGSRDLRAIASMLTG